MSSTWAKISAAGPGSGSQGPRGTDVRLRFAEMLYDNGMINQENLRSARAEDHYILKGEGEETWEPRFTYHGFRYVELDGLPRNADGRIRSAGRVVHSAVRPIGSFAASKDILNRLQRIVTWGQKTNLHSIPTDCDQRDERMGWMGDAQGTAEEAMMNFDMAAFYTNFVRDIRDVQDEKGRITDTVPHIWGRRPADPAWGTAYPLLCWYMYQYYGDTRDPRGAIRRAEEIRRVPAEQGRERAGQVQLLRRLGGRREDARAAIVSSFYYYYDVKILADAARILGKAPGRGALRQARWRISGRPSTANSYNPKTGNYADGTQTANTLPLFLGIATDKEGAGLGPAVRRHRLQT